MKFKKIPPEYFIKILDRLTRFEPAYVRYKRVFDDIINKFAHDIKLKNLTLINQIELVEEIIQSSISADLDDYIKPYLMDLENRYFIYNELSYQYLSSRINYSNMLAQVYINENSAQNIIWLKNLKPNCNLDELRKENALLYPIQKVLLCEGETERVLFEFLLKLFGVDFKKLGILLIAAGGKNQVARKFYDICEYTKLPIYVLLDSDAEAIKSLIDKKLRPIDKIYILKSGEFEDLIPPEILINAINYIHKNDIHCTMDDFSAEYSTVHNLEFIYKKYGFGEFKKSLFANQIKEYIEKYCSKADFENTEIEYISKEFLD